MDMTSPIFAALGVAEFDALNDLANWLDAFAEPAAEYSGRSGDQAMRAAGRSSGGEG